MFIRVFFVCLGSFWGGWAICMIFQAYWGSVWVFCLDLSGFLGFSGFFNCLGGPF